MPKSWDSDEKFRIFSPRLQATKTLTYLSKSPNIFPLIYLFFLQTLVEHLFWGGFLICKMGGTIVLTLQAADVKTDTLLYSVLSKTALVAVTSLVEICQKRSWDVCKMCVCEGAWSSEANPRSSLGLFSAGWGCWGGRWRQLRTRWWGWAVVGGILF